ncbi:MAG: Holliday junction resolvase RuvX [Acidimicrobiia bacterium]|nr:Holliday junction resolvase RuvX [Acidimicrobiia bacterium]MXX00831.1 Holliday junction resolvase RuvX [Acidimicrobiia bacterium]MXY73341.1 Holliday junction resolvase RuvX [Acidimicrobiia bacterium]MYB79185.1 Holliday junction resolvase RuvX [Acidimicrobiia bacterium]MYD40150.1 Holliday junction resolvase RuvX [Acidimicrobiia bacterium]
MPSCPRGEDLAASSWTRLWSRPQARRPKPFRRCELGRVLAVDPGERRVGVALSDAGGTIAQPWTVIDRSRSDVVAEVEKIAREHHVETIVVGLPVSLSGREGPSAASARRLAEKLGSATGLTVEMHDERYSTVAAERIMRQGGAPPKKRRHRRDKVAAAIILSEYLMGRSPGVGESGGRS